MSPSNSYRCPWFFHIRPVSFTLNREIFVVSCRLVCIERRNRTGVSGFTVRGATTTLRAAVHIYLPCVYLVPVGQQELQSDRPTERSGWEVPEQVPYVLHPDEGAVQRIPGVSGRMVRVQILRITWNAYGVRSTESQRLLAPCFLSRNRAQGNGCGAHTVKGTGRLRTEA